MTAPHRPTPPFLPTWGYWVIGTVLVALAVLLAAAGKLDAPFALLQLVGLFLGGLAIYFLPALIAKSTPRFAAILAANLFFGWTIIGWIIVFIWALGEAGSLKKS